MGPFVMGYMEVTIPYEEVAGLIHKDSAFGQRLIGNR